MTMASAGMTHSDRPVALPLDILRCPLTRKPLRMLDGFLVPEGQEEPRYRVDEDGIPLFAEHFCSAEARVQERHYDKVAADYVANLGYPHTQEYMAYLDRVLLDRIVPSSLGTIVEICCGHGESVKLLGPRPRRTIGIDISHAMLRTARREHASPSVTFVQGDATMLPLADSSVDSAFMLGGVHHVNDREKLFREISRILKPGGFFYFREPVSDFLLWRAIRAAVYRLSPALDHETERPLLYEETVPVLDRAGLNCTSWSTHGFLGFCFFMNSDVLVFNRLFRFVPGIRAITRWATRLDEWTVSLPGLRRAGLQVVGVARKPEPGSSSRP
jgi:SAM-dependent methyltransferase